MGGGPETVANNSRQTVMLIDGYGLIFRAYHAIDSAMATSTGEQTNAVFGFTRMLLDVLHGQRPDYAIVALEGGKTFRHDEYDGYKANRAAMPEDLRSQVSRVREIIDAMNIPIIEREGYEADDVIGSLSHRLADEHGLNVLIVTGDSDLLQLVEPHVSAVLPGRPRFQDLRVYDLDAVLDRFGFGPELIPDYKALVGDTSDNIPGVPGIGDKTAKSLITQFGDVEQIIEHVDEITPTRAKNALEGNVDVLRQSKRLATIVTTIDIEPDLDHCAVENFDRDKVIDLFRELEFRSLVARLPEPRQAETVAPRNARERPNRTLVTSHNQLERIISKIRKTGEYAFDVETTSTNPITASLVGLAIAVSPTESWYLAFDHGDPSLGIAETGAALDPVISDSAVKGYAHHAKYDLHVLSRHGIDVTNLEFDTMIAAYLLGENSVGLKDLAFSRLGIEMTNITELIGTGKNQLSMSMVPVEQVAEYACGDVEATFELVNYYRPLIEQHNQRKLMEEIELPLVPVLVDMEQTGVAIDSDYLSELEGEIRQRIKELDAEIMRLAGRPINVNSSRQLGALLFDELKLPSGRRTKTGYSVDQDHLETIRDQHPIVGVILEQKALGKLLSTYVSALPLEVNPATGRIHTSYNQTVAATGRLSSQSPNLQNIPIRTELGRRVRRAFIADRESPHRLFDNSVMVSADYSQIELRLMAHMSQEPFLIDAFKAGTDIHRATAALVHGVDISAVTPEMRRIAKTVNFGVLYGMQAFGLSRDTGLSRADATAFIEQYWSRLPKVKLYFEETLRKGKSLGYVESLYGRRRAVPGLESTNGQIRLAAERVATNMPLQGTAADIMKIAMIRMHERLAEHRLHARMLLQVHDELVFEVDESELKPTAKLIREVMESAATLTVPLVVDVSCGPNWDEQEELEIA